jgi:protein arginine N-methyltransferase 1
MTLLVPRGCEYEREQVWMPCSESILEWNTEFHDLLLNDHIRMVAYRAAIEESVQPGMSVLDLGTGTGILAQWALEAGAERVYGVDVNATILGTAVERIQRAGYGGRFHPIHGLSYDVRLPERVDVIVSEVMGNLADNEDCVRILIDARRRLLRDSGRMIPSRLDSYLVPVSAARAHDQVRRGEHRGSELTVCLDDALQRRGVRSRFDCYYDVILSQATHLGTPRVVRLYTFDVHDQPTYRVATVFAVQREGMFTGFKGYFVATLSETVALDISGDDIEGRTASDSWKHCYLPVEEPVAVEPGDRIRLVFERSYPTTRGAFGQRYRWEGEVVREGTVITRFEHDTRPG